QNSFVPAGSLSRRRRAGAATPPTPATPPVPARDATDATALPPIPGASLRPGDATPGPGSRDVGWRGRSPATDAPAANDRPPCSKSTARHRPGPARLGRGPTRHAAPPNANGDSTPGFPPPNPPPPFRGVHHAPYPQPVPAGKRPPASLRAIPRGVALFFASPSPGRENAPESRPTAAPPAASPPVGVAFRPARCPAEFAFALRPWPPVVAPTPGWSSPPRRCRPWPPAWPPPHTIPSPCQSKASLSSSAGLSCWCGPKPQRSRIGQPKGPSRGSFPGQPPTTPPRRAVRNGIGPARRWCALRRLWGKNSAVAEGFGLEFLLQPSAHPFTAFGFHCLFQVPQRARGFAFEAHRVSFRSWVSFAR